MSWDDGGDCLSRHVVQPEITCFMQVQGGVMEDSERKLFIDVVDLGSLSKAAAKHFVTPQSVSSIL